jgi:hypothetical protein
MESGLQQALVAGAVLAAGLTLAGIILAGRSLRSTDRAESHRQAVLEELDQAKRLVVTAEFDDGSREVLVKASPKSKTARRIIERALSNINAA